MTISTTTIKNSYSGNGSTSVFNYTFKITDDDDIQVIIRSSSGTETIKTKTTHYTVAGVGNSSGSITFTSGNIPANGETVVWTSGGSVGFKGSRKSTPYAAQVAAEEAVRRATEFGIHKLDIIISGTGAGRETAVRTLQNMGMDVGTIKDITPTPHNGCRPKKRRRN